MGLEIPACSEESLSDEGSQRPGKLRQGGWIPNEGLVTPFPPCSGAHLGPGNLGKEAWPRDVGTRYESTSSAGKAEGAPRGTSRGQGGAPHSLMALVQDCEMDAWFLEGPPLSPPAVSRPPL